MQVGISWVGSTPRKIDDVGCIVIDQDPRRGNQVHNAFDDLAGGMFAMVFEDQGEVIFLEIGHQVANMLRHFLVGGHGFVFEVCFADRRHDVVAAKEGCQAHIGDKIA